MRLPPEISAVLASVVCADALPRLRGAFALAAAKTRLHLGDFDLGDGEWGDQDEAFEEVLKFVETEADVAKWLAALDADEDSDDDDPGDQDDEDGDEEDDEEEA
ncbi:hypothetical protein M885DRAFT_623621 [Pelagophyceae sp. CCMP2097]|nr:hypothetical protein M885DRAFT_623621 [Pelagophyceae sp. CCMP2097]